VRSRKIAVWSLGVVVACAIILAFGLRFRHWILGSIQIQGAVIRREDDPRKELPVSEAVVTVSDGTARATAQSDASGSFTLTIRKHDWTGQTLALSFRHPDYKPLDLKLQTGIGGMRGRLFVAAMTPLPEQVESTEGHRAYSVTNIRVRYTTNSRTQVNIGSAVRTFQVVNQGNQPCNHSPVCSPDGRWKATSGSISLDAGQDNEFQNIRASCIAGPCPFTRIDSNGFAHGGRNITVGALNWSDTTTFLLEAEVFHVSIVSNVRESFPVIFGRSLNFTLPPTQEGVSLEADINGAPMVFPLGPNLYLSWAACTARRSAERENATVYQCELKPGYQFQPVS
jgi:hypothetical protein